MYTIFILISIFSFILFYLTFNTSTEYFKTCLRNCPKMNKPVCDTNGKKYTNKCLFDNAQCNNPSLKLGKCNDAPGPSLGKNCGKKCSKNKAPVCGSDGKTYGNQCSFNVAQCENPGLKMVKKGTCGSGKAPNNCKNSCSQNYEPICGTNGNRYLNECYLELARCKTGDQQLRKVNNTDCFNRDVSIISTKCKKTCPSNPMKYEVICGSDGNSYINDCEFSMAQCENPQLVKVKDGGCAPVRPQ